MDASLLAAISGVVLSLAFSYVPKLKDWFAKLEGDYKRLVMLVVLFLTAAGILGLACIGRYDAVTCDADGVWQMVEIFIMAAIANQGAFLLTPKKGKS